jgi:hypothetical protein
MLFLPAQSPTSFSPRLPGGTCESFRQLAGFVSSILDRVFRLIRGNFAMGFRSAVSRSLWSPTARSHPIIRGSPIDERTRSTAPTSELLRHWSQRRHSVGESVGNSKNGHSGSKILTFIGWGVSRC